jgi:hypothetical protein
MSWLHYCYRQHMPAKTALACALLVTAVSISAQMQTLSPGLRKLNGTEPTTGTTYIRIFRDGILVPPNSPADATPLPTNSPPALIAQCTQTRNSKLAFELHAHYGGVEDTAYYPPWRSTGPDDIYPPETLKVTIAMEFFGYTKVKPAKRQWEYLIAPAGELRYNPPSMTSRNLEDITFYLQYLKALPTLRLTSPDKAAQFNTTPLLEAIRHEPLCHASGL